MFVGRENELAKLESLYQKENFQMVVVYGRRRVGKTTLLSHFMENKPAIFFTAQEASDQMNLQELSRKLYAFFGLPEATGSFENWNAAFDFIAQKAIEKRFVLIFDEFPYAVNSNPALPSILQNVIDHKLKETGAYLILCGSQVGFMETEVLGYKSPLFGRRTAQIEVDGLDYYDAGKMLQAFSEEEKIILYSCFGGTPHYLAQIDDKESVEENVTRLYFDISGYLYNEPMMLLQQELREPAMYNSIVTTIASGATRVSEIAAKLQTTPNKISMYLDTLLKLHIIKKECPFGEMLEKSRKSQYRVADNCYLFWYRFVFPLKPEIEAGNGERIARKMVFGEALSDYVGKPPFEEICRQFLRREDKKGNLPFEGLLTGSWWGNDKRQKKQTDVDVIMADRLTKSMILGECKWKNEFKDVAEIEKLLQKKDLFPEYDNQYYAFFSKTAYSRQALEMKKKNDRLMLYTLKDLFQE